ncbi:hypothetical protein [Fulvimarina endophytica]|uniref:hypothetical protein n=1 Tax=Fulvimarina endophytica TaxID=2293836 RepID=UPI0018F7A280|nr:hypothetical protein [Fulvimarina endophytica]
MPHDGQKNPKIVEGSGVFIDRHGEQAIRLNVDYQIFPNRQLAFISKETCDV